MNMKEAYSGVREVVDESFNTQVDFGRLVYKINRDLIGLLLKMGLYTTYPKVDELIQMLRSKT